MFTLPWSQIIAENVWWICALIFMSFRVRPMRQARRDPVQLSKRPASDFILLRLAEFAFGVMPFAYVLFKVPAFANYPWYPPFVVVGTLVFAAAIWVIYRSHKDLGRSFSTTLEIRPQHELVTSGIYRYVRHPIYLAFSLWGLAQAFLLPNWAVAVSGPIILAILFSIRIPREEQMMIDTFGDDYRVYMSRTARFVPGVY
jgi:protein-S-isoprenylcysteine O-methyltransferase Ste14